MAISYVLKRHKWTLCILVSITFIIGGLMMFEYFNLTKEERRNRDYEVSLVNALKNSYEGIEEIRITDPHYTEIPGSWSCDVEILFQDGEKIAYGINHALNREQNYGGRQRTDVDWQYLEQHRGKTILEIKVIHSDGEEKKQ